MKIFSLFFASILLSVSAFADLTVYNRCSAPEPISVVGAGISHSGDSCFYVNVQTIDSYSQKVFTGTKSDCNYAVGFAFVPSVNCDAVNGNSSATLNLASNGYCVCYTP